MILSFHPLFEADRHILCAGRSPSIEDLAAVKKASAVILPQGCSAALYHLARKNCPRVFPNYDARFRYPGKIGQIQLFQKTKTPYPATTAFSCLDKQDNPEKAAAVYEYPFVFKFDWGGEGANVHLIENDDQYQYILKKAAEYEKTGQYGFLIQEFIPAQRKSLRVVVIGEQILSYWRTNITAGGFATSVRQGAQIDPASDPDRQAAAREATRVFCRKTGINLAGIDILFSLQKNTDHPLFLEINYFFGRRGLGGSEKYYQLLDSQIKIWLKRQGLAHEP